MALGDNTIALRSGLTAEVLLETDTGPAHLWLAGFDDDGRPFKLDLRGWPADFYAKTPLNKILMAIDHAIPPTTGCLLCGRAEPDEPTTEPTQDTQNQGGE